MSAYHENLGGLEGRIWLFYVKFVFTVWVCVHSSLCAGLYWAHVVWEQENESVRACVSITVYGSVASCSRTCVCLFIFFCLEALHSFHWLNSDGVTSGRGLVAERAPSTRFNYCKLTLLVSFCAVSRETWGPSGQPRGPGSLVHKNKHTHPHWYLESTAGS